MALVRFTNTASITTQVRCDREWVLPITGGPGTASLSLTWDNPAASEDYIAMDGGSRVFVYSEDGCGTWSGVVLTVDRDRTGLRLGAVQDHAILGRVPVSLNTDMPSTVPNEVMYAALHNAGEVLGLHIVNGPWGASTPPLDSYSFSRQDVWSVATDMMSVSDGELHVDTETQGMYWCGPHAYASAYPALLLGDANLREWSASSSASDRIAQVTAIAPDGTTATAADARGGWPAQAVLDATTARSATRQAEQELNNRATSTVTISGGVPLAHWDIRERMFVRVIIPRWGGVPSRAYTCRVLGRAVSEGNPLMSLTLLIVDMAPDRPRFRPATTTRARGRGTGPLRRRVAQLERSRAA